MFTGLVKIFREYSHRLIFILPLHICTWIFVICMCVRTFMYTCLYSWEMGLVENLSEWFQGASVRYRLVVILWELVFKIKEYSKMGLRF